MARQREPLFVRGSLRDFQRERVMNEAAWGLLLVAVEGGDSA